MYTAGFLESDIWSNEIGHSGWGVKTINPDKTKYGNILTTINNKDVTIMQCTFADCKDINTAPIIPETVTILNGAFGGSSISTASAVPSSVSKMNHAFAGCENLTVIVIHANPTTFEQCLTKFRIARS